MVFHIYRSGKIEVIELLLNHNSPLDISSVTFLRLLILLSLSIYNRHHHHHRNIENTIINNDH